MIVLNPNKALEVRTHYEGADVPRLQHSILQVSQIVLNQDMTPLGRESLATLLGFLEELLLDEKQVTKALETGEGE